MSWRGLGLDEWLMLDMRHIGDWVLGMADFAAESPKSSVNVNILRQPGSQLQREHALPRAMIRDQGDSPNAFECKTIPDMLWIPTTKQSSLPRWTSPPIHER
jgi:hypothetical protein